MKKVMIALGLCPFLAPVVFGHDWSELLERGTPEQVQEAISECAKDENDEDFSASELLASAATRSPNPEVIKVLLKAGADVNYELCDWSFCITPLMAAAFDNPNPEVIMALLKAGAKLDDRDKDGLAALMMAACNSNLEVITVLLKAGANAKLKSNKQSDGNAHTNTHHKEKAKC